VGSFLCLMSDLIAPSVRPSLHHRFTADCCAVPAKGTYSRKDGKVGYRQKLDGLGFLTNVNFNP
jgi:hypothetical protein